MNAYLVLCRSSSKTISKAKCIEIVSLNATRYKMCELYKFSLDLYNTFHFKGADLYQKLLKEIMR